MSIGITSDEARELTLQALRQPGMAELRDVFSEQVLDELKHARECLTLAIGVLESAKTSRAAPEAWSPLLLTGYFIQHAQHMQTVGDLSNEIGRIVVEATMGDDA